MKNFFIKHWQNNKQVLLLIVTALFFVAGVVQFAFGLTYVLWLTPIFLALIAATALIFWEISPKRKALVVVSIIIFGLIIELIGVHTGYLFGDYSYGTVLGYKLWGVPITIGITWFIVTLSAWHIVSFGKLTKIQLFILGGILVVMFDLVLEQFAITYGLWAWHGGRVPLSNYITWFLVALLILFAYSKVDKKPQPSIYVAGLLPLMAIFFWLMLLVR